MLFKFTTIKIYLMKPKSLKISKRFITTLARPLTITIARRNMWSFLKKGGEKGIGHAPKLMEALEKKAADAAPATTQIPHNNAPVPPKFDPEELMKANRKWPELSPKSEEPVQASSTFKTGSLGTSNFGSKTTLTPANTQAVPHTHTRGYAVRTVNHPDPNNPDPQASKNNGVVQKGPHSFQHDEVHRITCINPACQGKACAGLCNTVKDRKAVANLTTSPKQISNGKTLKLGKAYKGNAQKNNKDQHLNVFKKNHTTKSTSEDKQGTGLINQPSNSTQIINAEDPT